MKGVKIFSLFSFLIFSFAQARAFFSLPQDCQNFGQWDENSLSCVLTQDINSSLKITQSNFTLDCNNHKIIGDGREKGIFGDYFQNVEIKNCQIKNFAIGIFFGPGVKNSKVTKNLIEENKEIGISLDGGFSWGYQPSPNNNYLSENEIRNNKIGIKLFNARLNTLENNLIEGNNETGISLGYGFQWGSCNQNNFKRNRIRKNKTGVYLGYSQMNSFLENEIEENSDSGIVLDANSNRNEIRENRFNANRIGVLIQESKGNKILKNNFFNDGVFIVRAFENIFEENFVNEKPLIYLEKIQNQKISQEAGQIVLINAKNVEIENVKISNTFSALLFLDSEGLKIKDNYFSNNFYGIYSHNSSQNSIEQNIFNKNQIGIFLNWSNLNSLTKNEFNFNTTGASIYSSSENRISENRYFGNGDGIFIDGSRKNILEKNFIKLSKGYGIKIIGSQNTFKENLIWGNKIGVLISSGSGNSFFHNDFLKNQTQIRVEGRNNSFDAGYPPGGNFWSDYQGEDKRSGENQDQEGSDGIGDTPYFITQEFRDRYPLFRKRSGISEVLISEVYYDVLREKEKEGENEWVILFNLENEEIDLKGWQICSKKEKENCTQFSGKILSKGFAILSPTSTTFELWEISPEMTKIVLGKKFGSYGLNNEGDNLFLKDDQGNIIDELSYGNDNSIFDPPAIDVKEGKSLLRFPKDQDTNTAQDFIESEPTIKRKSLCLKIDFFPKNPVKGIEVKFDASSSTHLTGQIINFEWQIKNASTSEILATSSATTTSFVFKENGNYEITLIATDNEGATSSTSTILKIEPFSFAIITDLHIGRQYREEYRGEDYYLTERLKNVVRWVNENKDKIKCGNEICSIRFLVILGDITENTSISGFCKTKEILDNLEIPYVVVFGNHDVGTDEEYEQGLRWKGQDYFDQVFWSTSSIPCQNATSTKNFETLLEEFNFERDEKNKDYKNFSFSFGGFNFIGLDFVSREKFARGLGYGVRSDATLNEINKNWLKEKLEDPHKNSIILFTHHSFTQKYRGILDFSNSEIKEIEKLLTKKNVLINFGGHIHSFEEIHGLLAPFNANIEYDPIAETKIFTTEALMVGSNGRGIKDETKENGVVDDKKGIIRIVKVFDVNNIKPNNWETTEKRDEFKAFNPYLNFGFSVRQKLNIPCVEVEAQAFTEKQYQIHWDFGDGEVADGIVEKTKCYNTGGKYRITLTLKDLNSSFSESISKEVEVKEGIIPKTIKKIEEYYNQGIEFISETAQMSFRKIGQIKKDIVSISKKKSPLKPIGKIIVHFESLNDDLDLTGLNADTDLEKQKTILYMEKWPQEVERSKVLFVPKK